MEKSSIVELASKLGRHPSTVYRWISGDRQISSEDAARLEKITGIDRRAWLWPDEYNNPYMPRES